MKIKILDLKNNRATVKLLAEIPTQAVDEKTERLMQSAALCYGWGNEPRSTVQDTVNVDANLSAIPRAEQYVYADFRALSQTLLRSRGLDLSTPGVLQAAVDKLTGKTVYPNHEARDIYNWLGAVESASWDAAGANFGNIPGINCRIKVDALMNFRIARGLLMNPPAINAMSLTILFAFEYSHPRLVEERNFWNNIGEEIEGSIVRLIVTEIVDIWEASLVWRGEDELAVQILPDGAEADAAETDDAAAMNGASEPKTEKNKMILTKEQKSALGIALEADDVPESEVLNAALAIAEKTPLTVAEIAELSLKAKQGEQLLAKQRAEIKRLAALAELGSAEGTLNEVLSKMIDNAGLEDLEKLETLYREKTKTKFGDGRSSSDNARQIENAGGINNDGAKPKPLAPVKVL